MSYEQNAFIIFWSVVFFAISNVIVPFNEGSIVVDCVSGVFCQTCRLMIKIPERVMSKITVTMKPKSQLLFT